VGNRILLLDVADSPDAGLAFQLRQCGFAVRTAADPDSVARLQRNSTPALTIVRVTRADSADLLRALSMLADVALVVVCPNHDPDLVVQCVEAGADTVLVAPRCRGELASRIRAALSWSNDSLLSGEWRCPKPYRVGDLTIDPESHMVTKAGHDIALTPTEFRLLAALARRAGETVEHADLVADVWGAVCPDMRNNLRLYVRYLRRKLTNHHSKPSPIQNDRGIGYRLAAETT
jgi:two-component system KDP operon response regulator KdpE